ncbi:MAG: hypothetical protein JWM80_2143 [Cyanobacteria bacterium RYN_339]|nr:hypothetical protein [Cyanobacteria bacterium RYN_339]
MLTALLLFHVAALAGVLAFARYDAPLVDDRPGDWQEQRVAAPPVEVLTR